MEIPARVMTCHPVMLPQEEWGAARRTAIKHNPKNRGNEDALASLLGTALVEASDADVLIPQAIAIMTTKYWGPQGVTLDVFFMDVRDTTLQNRILAHMNAWSDRCNVKFTLSNSPAAKVRISTGPGGYYSYLGTDILHIPQGQQTMNLEAFNLNTPESEYRRVVRHETGHTLGCPHEHMRAEIIAKLDPNKTIAYFRAHYGWSAQTTQQQVLTPISEQSLMGTPHPEQDSIMCYEFDGACTLDGRPIIGGTDITEDDYRYMSTWYPKPNVPVVPPPPPPPPGDTNLPVSVPLSRIIDALAKVGKKVM